MNVILRGVRLIDPIAGVDGVRDVWLRDGRVAAIADRIDGDGAVGALEVSAQGLMLAPGFIDLHAHLREPGGEVAENVASGSRAAAAGGFTQVLAMANTEPPVDNPARVRRAVHRGQAASGASVLAAATVSHGLLGRRMVDVAGCAAAGAAAFSDDGRNAITPPLLVAALRAAAAVGRTLLVHPEDEQLVRLANPEGVPVTHCVNRPAAAELSAVAVAVHSLARAGAGRLHLQHLSCGDSLELLERARDAGLSVSAEVTPHHLLLDGSAEARPPALVKVNPPLRTGADRERLLQALDQGLIEAVATDHAPHPALAKGDDLVAASPGMIGLETALAACLSAGVRPEVTVERLTAGPWRILGAGVGLRQPTIGTGLPADLVLFDPAREWTVTETRSRSRNTPLFGATLRGKVLLTLAAGRVVHGAFDELSPSRAPIEVTVRD